MTFSYSILKKFLAISLSLCLLFTSGQIAEAALGVSQFPARPILPALTPPSALGRIIDSFDSNTKAASSETPKQVILIQDLHAHYGVQKNIAGILDFIDNKLRTAALQNGGTPVGRLSGTAAIGSLIEKSHLSPPLRSAASPDSRPSGKPPLSFALAVEGAAGPIDSSVMALFPDEKVKQAAADYLMREGELTGAEYFAVMRGIPNLLVGVEDERYYTLHRELFRKTLSDRDQLVHNLETIQKDITPLRKKLYSRDMRKLQRRIDAFEKGNLSAEDYIQYLASLADNYGLPFQAGYPLLAEFLQNPRGGHEAKLDYVFHQAAELAFRLKLAGAKKGPEKDLVQVEHDLALLMRVADLQATELEVRDFAPRINQFVALADSLLRQASGSNQKLRQLISASIDYYVMALMRNQPMVDNTLALIDTPERRQPRTAGSPERRHTRTAARGTHLKQQHLSPPLRNADALESRPSGRPPVAVLVAGGFHTGPITQILRDKKISYIVISPTVDQITDADHALYVKRLKGDLLTVADVVAAAPTAFVSEAPGLKSRLARLWDAHVRHEALPPGVWLVNRGPTAVVALASAAVTIAAGVALAHGVVDVHTIANQLHAFTSSLPDWAAANRDAIATAQASLAVIGSGIVATAIIGGPGNSSNPPGLMNRSQAVARVFEKMVNDYAAGKLSSAQARENAAKPETWWTPDIEQGTQAIEIQAARAAVYAMVAHGFDVMTARGPAWNPDLFVAGASQKASLVNLPPGLTLKILAARIHGRWVQDLIEANANATLDAWRAQAITQSWGSKTNSYTAPLQDALRQDLHRLPTPTTIKPWNAEAFIKQTRDLLGVNEVLPENPSADIAEGTFNSAEDEEAADDAPGTLSYTLQAFSDEESEDLDKKPEEILVLGEDPGTGTRLKGIEWLSHEDILPEILAGRIIAKGPLPRRGTEDISVRAMRQKTLFVRVTPNPVPPEGGMPAADQRPEQPVALNQDRAKLDHALREWAVVEKIELTDAQIDRIIRQAPTLTSSLSDGKESPFILSQILKQQIPNRDIRGKAWSDFHHTIMPMLKASPLDALQKLRPTDFSHDPIIEHIQVDPKIAFKAAKKFVLPEQPTLEFLGQAPSPSESEPFKFKPLLPRFQTNSFKINSNYLNSIGNTVTKLSNFIPSPIKNLWTKFVIPLKKAPSTYAKNRPRGWWGLGLTAMTFLKYFPYLDKLEPLTPFSTFLIAALAVAGILYFIGAKIWDRHLENIADGKGVVRTTSPGLSAESWQVASKLREILGSAEADRIDAVVVNDIQQIDYHQFERRVSDPLTLAQFMNEGFFFDKVTGVLYVHSKVGVGATSHWFQSESSIVRLAFAAIGEDGRSTIFVHKNLTLQASEKPLELMLKNMIGGIHFYRSEHVTSLGRYAEWGAQIAGNVYEAVLGFTPTSVQTVWGWVLHAERGLVTKLREGLQSVYLYQGNHFAVAIPIIIPKIIWAFLDILPDGVDLDIDAMNQAWMVRHELLKDWLRPINNWLRPIAVSGLSLVQFVSPVLFLFAGTTALAAVLSQPPGDSSATHPSAGSATSEPSARPYGNVLNIADIGLEAGPHEEINAVLERAFSEGRVKDMAIVDGVHVFKITGVGDFLVGAQRGHAGLARNQIYIAEGAYGDAFLLHHEIEELKLWQQSALQLSEMNPETPWEPLDDNLKRKLADDLRGHLAGMTEEDRLALMQTMQDGADHLAAAYISSAEPEVASASHPDPEDQLLTSAADEVDRILKELGQPPLESYERYNPRRVYRAFLKARYDMLRKAAYIKSDQDDAHIDAVTSVTNSETTLIGSQRPSWHARVSRAVVPEVMTHNGSIATTVSLNAFANPKLISALDHYFATSGVIGYYKTSPNIVGWLNRHDSVIFYIFDKLTPEIEADLVRITRPYVRSSEGLFGRKLAPGLYVNTNPTADELARRIQAGGSIREELGQAIDDFLRDMGGISGSVGQREAVNQVLQFAIQHQKRSVLTAPATVTLKTPIKETFYLGGRKNPANARFKPGVEVEFNFLGEDLHIKIPSTGQSFNFHGGEIHIGRAPQNDVVLTNNIVSSQHLLLRYTPEGQWELHDNTTRNGTFDVEEHRVQTKIIETNREIPAPTTSPGSSAGQAASAAQRNILPGDTELIDAVKTKLVIQPRQDMTYVGPKSRAMQQKAQRIVDRYAERLKRLGLTNTERDLFHFIVHTAVGQNTPMTWRLFEHGGSSNVPLTPNVWFGLRMEITRRNADSNDETFLDPRNYFQVLKHEWGHVKDFSEDVPGTNWISGDALLKHRRLYAEFRANLYAFDWDYEKAFQATERTYRLTALAKDLGFLGQSPEITYRILQRLSIEIDQPLEGAAREKGLQIVREELGKPSAAEPISPPSPVTVDPAWQVVKEELLKHETDPKGLADVIHGSNWTTVMRNAGIDPSTRANELFLDQVERMIKQVVAGRSTDRLRPSEFIVDVLDLITQYQRLLEIQGEVKAGRGSPEALAWQAIRYEISKHRTASKLPGDVTAGFFWSGVLKDAGINPYTPANEIILDQIEKIIRDATTGRFISQINPREFVAEVLSRLPNPGPGAKKPSETGANGTGKGIMASIAGGLGLASVVDPRTHTLYQTFRDSIQPYLPTFHISGPWMFAAVALAVILLSHRQVLQDFFHQVNVDLNPFWRRAHNQEITSLVTTSVHEEGLTVGNEPNHNSSILDGTANNDPAFERRASAIRQNLERAQAVLRAA